jgi:hypothetical protein
VGPRSSIRTTQSVGGSLSIFTTSDPHPHGKTSVAGSQEARLPVGTGKPIGGEAAYVGRLNDVPGAGVEDNNYHLRRHVLWSAGPDVMSILERDAITAMLASAGRRRSTDPFE